MQLREQEYFIAIVQYKSLSAAAKSLHVSQPSLSKFLKTQEEALGVKLFMRTNKGLELSEAGKLYYETATRMVSLQREFFAKLAESSREKKKSVNLGLTPVRGLYILPMLLPPFRQQHPHCELNIVEGNVFETLKNVQEGRVDLAFWLAANHSAPGVKLINICTEEILLCVSQNHHCVSHLQSKPGFKYPWIDLNYFKNEVFLLPNQETFIGSVQDNIFSLNNFKPSKTMHFPNLEQTIRLSSENYGVSFVTEICVNYNLSRDKPLYLSFGRRPFHAYFVAGHQQNKALSAEEETLLSIAEEIFG